MKRVLAVGGLSEPRAVSRLYRHVAHSATSRYLHTWRAREQHQDGSETKGISASDQQRRTHTSTNEATNNQSCYSHERGRVVELGLHGHDGPQHGDGEQHGLLGGGQHDERRQRHREQERPQGQLRAGEAARRSGGGRRRGLAGLRRRGVHGGHVC
jgi:hypothetical protein